MKSLNTRRPLFPVEPYIYYDWREVYDLLLLHQYKVEVWQHPADRLPRLILTSKTGLAGSYMFLGREKYA